MYLSLSPDLYSFKEDYILISMWGSMANVSILTDLLKELQKIPTASISDALDNPFSSCSFVETLA